MIYIFGFQAIKIAPDSNSRRIEWSLKKIDLFVKFYNTSFIYLLNNKIKLSAEIVSTGNIADRS